MIEVLKKIDANYLGARSLRIFVLLILVNCSNNLIAEHNPSRWTVLVEERPFTFVAPDGYCFDRPTLQDRRGRLDPTQRLTDLVASDCKIVDGKAHPTKLRFILSTSVTQTDEPDIESFTKDFNKVSEYPVVKQGGFYRFPDETGITALDVINGFFVLIRAVQIEEHNRTADELIEETLKLIRLANPDAK